MNLTLSVDEQIVNRARKRATALGKPEPSYPRFLGKLAGADDPERNIREFEELSARGHSHSWKFNRDQTHETS